MQQVGSLTMCIIMQRKFSPILSYGIWTIKIIMRRACGWH